MFQLQRGDRLAVAKVAHLANKHTCAPTSGKPASWAIRRRVKARGFALATVKAALMFSPGDRRENRHFVAVGQRLAGVGDSLVDRHAKAARGVQLFGPRRRRRSINSRLATVAAPSSVRVSGRSPARRAGGRSTAD